MKIPDEHRGIPVFCYSMGVRCIPMYIFPEFMVIRMYISLCKYNSYKYNVGDTFTGFYLDNSINLSERFIY
jgi:hypothetical protein